MRHISVKENFGGPWKDAASYIYMRAEPRKVDSLQYWRTALALYVSRKRSQSGKAQKEAGKSRKTVSNLERVSANPTLETILAVIESVGGDISEAFNSHIPKALHGEHQAIHEMVQQILDTRDPEALRVIHRAVSGAFVEFVSGKAPNRGL